MVADELKQFRVDAETVYKVAVDEVEVAIGVPATLQYLKLGAIERACSGHVHR